MSLFTAPQWVTVLLLGGTVAFTATACGVPISKPTPASTTVRANAADQPNAVPSNASLPKGVDLLFGEAARNGEYAIYLRADLIRLGYKRSGESRTFKLPADYYPVPPNTPFIPENRLVAFTYPSDPVIAWVMEYPGGELADDVAGFTYDTAVYDKATPSRTIYCSTVYRKSEMFRNGKFDDGQLLAVIKTLPSYIYAGANSGLNKPGDWNYIQHRNSDGTLITPIRESACSVIGDLK